MSFRLVAACVASACVISIAGTASVFADNHEEPVTPGGQSLAEQNPVNDPALECDPASDSDTDCNLVAKYINPLIMFLSAFVGVAVTIGIITGGIKYASAGSDPGKVAAARKQITNSLIALVAFLFLGAALNWLVPGGIF